MLDRAAVLLNLHQVIQAGIKRHFKAASFSRIEVSGTGRYVTFEVTVLGLKFQVSVKYIEV